MERTDIVAIALLVAGATQVLTGVWLLLDPGGFYDAVATYPPRNDHFLRDLGSWNVALGAAAIYGARRPAWRTPMLGLLALQYALHTVSHVIDVDDTDPESLGVVNLVAIAAGAVLLGGLFLRERGRGRGR